MRRSLGLFVVLGALAVGGCGDPKLDGSSEAAFKKSMEDVKKPLDGTKKAKFEQAVATVMFNKVLFTESFGDLKASEAKIKEAFGGKTADQVIAEAEKIDADAKAKLSK